MGGEQDAKDLKNKKHDELDEPESLVMGNILTDIKVTYTDVEQAISELRSSNAAGYDGLTNNLIKELPDIIPTLVEAINMSLNEGISPDALKLAIVIPLFKNGSKIEVTNYRPISLIPTLSKIM